MRFVIVFLLCFLSVNLFAQYPVTQNLGNPNTIVTVPANGALRGVVVNRTFTDTTDANLYFFKYYPGAQIMTTSDTAMWLRNVLANKWVKMVTVSGGGGTPTDNEIWRVAGEGQVVINSLSGAGLGTNNAYPLWFVTTGNIRANIPATGFALQTDTTNNKVMVWNPTTKDWGYSNWNLGGGGGGSYTASNGITLSGSNFKLGGSLAENTTINARNFFFRADSATSMRFMKYRAADSSTSRLDFPTTSAIGWRLYYEDLVNSYDGATAGIQAEPLGSGVDLVLWANQGTIPRDVLRIQSEYHRLAIMTDSVQSTFLPLIDGVDTTYKPLVIGSDHLWRRMRYWPSSNAWSLTGNSGTTAGTNFIGNTDSVRFDVRTNNSIRMSVAGNGNIGIGTTSPSYNLDVRGTAQIYGSNASGPILEITNTSASLSSGISVTTGSSGSEFLASFSSSTGNKFAIRNNGAVAFNNTFGSSGQVLQSNGTSLPPSWVTLSASTLDNVLSNGNFTARTIRFDVPNGGGIYGMDGTDTSAFITLDGSSGLVYENITNPGSFRLASSLTSSSPSTGIYQFADTSGIIPMAVKVNGTKYTPSGTGLIDLGTISGSSGLTIGSTTITGGTSNNVLTQSGGVLQSSTGFQWNGNQVDINGTSNPGFRIYNSGTNGFYFYNGAGGAGNFGIFDITALADRMILTSTGVFKFGTNAASSPTMQLNASGQLSLGTTSPNAAAILDLSSTSRAFLLPRMTGAQVDAISGGTAGLQVYSTDGSGASVNSAGWWNFDGTNWVETATLQTTQSFTGVNTFSGGFSTTSYSNITSGTSSTLGNTITTVRFNPASVIATYTLTMPASPVDGQWIYISAGGTIAAGADVVSALTLSPNSGQSIYGGLTLNKLIGGDEAAYQYSSSNTTWYRKK